MKTGIDNFEDIVWFVDSFYDRLQCDEVIGPVFNTVIRTGSRVCKRCKFWNAALPAFPNLKATRLPDMHHYH
jgi:hemoglobin